MSDEKLEKIEKKVDALIEFIIMLSDGHRFLDAVYKLRKTIQKVDKK